MAAHADAEFLPSDQLAIRDKHQVIPGRSRHCARRNADFDLADGTL